jgi:F5/8 type C domain/Secretion system C-terminal sorting domain
MPPAPPYPNEPSAIILNNAQKISDSLEWYIKQWMDGRVPAQVPARYIPKGIVDSKNFYLKNPDSVTLEEIWATRLARPVNLDSCVGGVPDPNVTYLLMGPGLAPFGSKLVLEGEFPHCRFFSIQVTPPLDGKNYTATRYFGSAEVSWADADIDPLPGNVNPFRIGTDRNAENRKFKVEIKMTKGDGVALNNNAFKPLYREQGNIRYGSLLAYQGPWGEKDFLLNPKPAAGAGKWNLGALWVRIYAPDKSKGQLGGVAMPKAYFVLPDGRKYFLGADFSKLKQNANASMKARVINDPPDDIYSQPAMGWTKSWGILRNTLNGIAEYKRWDRQEYIPKINAVDLGVTGRGENMPAPGNYEPSATGNNYASYIGRGVNLQNGQVAVLIGKMPTFPSTRNGEPTLKKTQLRYWSICGYDNHFDAPVAACAINGIMDEDVKLDNERNYMIVYSRVNDKPANTNSKMTWVNWGPTSQLGLVMRYLTVSPEWDFDLSPNEIHLTWAKSNWSGSQYDSTLLGVNTHKGFMQCYLPRIAVMSKAEFEALGNNIIPSDIPVWMDKSNHIGVTEARNKPATASSIWNNEFQFQADKAFDGNLKTRWSSKFGEKNAFLSVDLGTVMKISGVKLFWDYASAKAYTIAVSDDNITWKTVYQTTNGNGGIDAISNIKISGRFVRMNATKSWWGAYSLWELEVVSPDMPCTYAPQEINGASASPIKIYPNPSIGQTIIDLSKVITTNTSADIQIFSSDGKLVHHKLTTDLLFLFNCLNWIAGIYYVKVMVSNNKYQLRFVKV